MPQPFLAADADAFHPGRARHVAGWHRGRVRGRGVREATGLLPAATRFRSEEHTSTFGCWGRPMPVAVPSVARSLSLLADWTFETHDDDSHPTGYIMVGNDTSVRMVERLRLAARRRASRLARRS